MKVPRGKLPLSVIAVLISGFALAGLIFTEDLRALTGTSILKLKACCKQDEIVHSSNVTKGNHILYVTCDNSYYCIALFELF